jgi:hypothetical protein
MRRAVPAVLIAVLFAVLPSTAAAADYPPYAGQSFPTIHGPADPEEFSWEVQLEEGQTLEQVDDQHAVVRWESGPEAFTIPATPAHDAIGTTVPTTLAVSEGNVITLTVHHRAGNPAEEGAPFVYPVSAGEGWEGGFATVTVTFPSPEPVAQPTPSCVVPNLRGKSLRASRRQLRKANCKLGDVRGEKARGAKVKRQFRRPGKVLPAGTEVSVKLS